MAVRPADGCPVLAVLVVAYGDPEQLRECLTALDAPPGAVTVVDNGLDEQVRRHCEALGATYVRPEDNLGFAVGVNRGLAKLAGVAADVLLLNPDACFRWEDACELQDRLRSYDSLAAVAPALQRPDGSQEPSSWPVPSPWGLWLDALGAGRLHRGRRFLTGAVLLLRAEALRQVGGFDERFFLYAEEADWQVRAQRSGWRISEIPDITAIHVGAGTSSDAATRNEYFFRSAMLFARKWYGPAGELNARLASAAARARRGALSRQRA